MRIFYYEPENLIINLEEAVEVAAGANHIAFTLKNQQRCTFINNLDTKEIKKIMKNLYELMTEEK